MAVKKQPSGQQFIKIRGARVHNLKNIDLDIPKNKLVVITGLSGSGKSSLAFDTIYAEAERRFVESLSTYARQFLGVKDKPEVESIDGLSPAISIDQKSISKNPRSTVGTITEIYDYLRILFARVGRPHCPNCQKPVGRQTTDQIVTAIVRLPRREEIIILGPLIRGQKGEHKNILEETKRAGFLRARIDGQIYLLDEALKLSLDKQKKHSLEVVVDRFTLGKEIDRSRIRDSVETALKIGKGLLMVQTGDDENNRPRSKLRGIPDGIRVLKSDDDVGVISSARLRLATGWHSARDNKTNDLIFSEKFACTECNLSMPEIEPRLFSFNSPYGACFSCTGIGSTLEVDPELVIPNKKLTIAEGAIRPWASASHRVGRQSWYWWILDDLAERHEFSLNTPISILPNKIINIILYGESSARSEIQNSKPKVKNSEGNFEGVIPNLKRRWKETNSDFTRAEIEKYMIIKTCPECKGRRLRQEALAIKIKDKNIAELAEKTIEETEKFFRELTRQKGLLKPNEIIIATPLTKEILKRLQFLKDVGLEYLTLARSSTTLSGGEAQRIQLATQIGSRLTGIIYILDEPSVGLHPRDHARLIATLKNLRDLGNTVIVVEHDRETMLSADWIIDLGPGAGKHGGRIIFAGTPKNLFKAKTLTGEYLSGRKIIATAKLKRQNSELKVRKKQEDYLLVKGASEHNLKNIDVKIPLGKLVCVSGVSGSGKSTLINDILGQALMAKFYRAHVFPGKHKEILGVENINKVIIVDQSPIGRTPRSNPATYTGAFSFIRLVFAKTIEARVRGYTPGKFSFNVKGGRCEVCEGQGVKKIEMYFLPDVYVECEECRGSRYSQEALEIEYNGKSIAQVLAMAVEEALEFFKAIPSIKAKFEALAEVGLGYIKLGQPAPTLSGGEAQRVKLATELSRRDTGKTFYILDEPTTGLHFDDIKKLLNVLQALVNKGNTVLVIEHNLDVLKNSDWIIDLGPEGGENGGKIVAEGTPQQITQNKNSYTGQWLLK